MWAGVINSLRRFGRCRCRVSPSYRAMHLLAVEVVSPSNPGTDYDAKSRDYPAMGIPHYLIVDPRDGTWTYQWQVGGRRGSPEYENRLRRPYGNTVALAGGWKVATGGLPFFCRSTRVRT